jgi:DivIVA domain-containing protein
MTLSLDDVRNKRFRMARKGGYEVLEVDEFVDEVEESFAQLLEENASLKKQVDALRSSDGAADTDGQAQQPASPAPAAETTRVSTPAAETTAPAAATPASTSEREPERIVVTTSAEASSAVVRLVQLSTEQAEHLVREANDEAAKIREDANRDAQQVTEDARTRADRLESEARVNADRVQTEAQSRSESLDQELAQRRTEMFGDLERQQESLTETVARLRDFEQRYRSNLADHLRGQLDSLDRVGLEPEGGPERTAPRATTSEGGEPTPSEAQHDPQASDRQPEGQQGGATPSGEPASSTTDDTTQSSATPRLDALLGEQR